MSPDDKGLYWKGYREVPVKPPLPRGPGQADAPGPAIEPITSPPDGSPADALPPAASPPGAAPADDGADQWPARRGAAIGGRDRSGTRAEHRCFAQLSPAIADGGRTV